MTVDGVTPVEALVLEFIAQRRAVDAMATATETGHCSHLGVFADVLGPGPGIRRSGGRRPVARSAQHVDDRLPFGARVERSAVPSLGGLERARATVGTGADPLRPG